MGSLLSCFIRLSTVLGYVLFEYDQDLVFTNLFVNEPPRRLCRTSHSTSCLKTFGQGILICNSLFYTLLPITLNPLETSISGALLLCKLFMVLFIGYLRVYVLFHL